MMTGCEENDNKITLDQRRPLPYTQKYLSIPRSSIYIYVCVHIRAILSIMYTRSIYALFGEDYT